MSRGSAGGRLVPGASVQMAACGLLADACQLLAIWEGVPLRVRASKKAILIDGVLVIIDSSKKSKFILS